MARYLVVAWDGAGNLVSTTAVAQSLSERGHDVRLGTGTMIGPDSDVDAIADAVRALLDERSLVREGAKRMATVFSGYGGASEAADEIERVTRN